MLTRRTYPSHLQADAIPNIPIYGGSKQGEAVNNLVKDKDEFKIAQDINIKYALPMKP